MNEILFPNKILMFNLIRSCLGVEEVENILYNNTAKTTGLFP